MKWVCHSLLIGLLGAALVPGVHMAGLMSVPPAVADETFASGTVEIVTRRGRFPVAVEIARTWSQRAQGLQNRKSVPEGTGMLFDFGRPQMVTMWMKNTYVPLDMLFVAADGKIVTIVQGTVPQSLEHISSEWPVPAVLELPAGAVASLGILPGDSVVNPMFGNVPLGKENR